MAALQNFRTKMPGLTSEEMAKPISYFDIYEITSALATFEAVLGAELALIPLYVVTSKAGFDTAVLIENGAACFPSEISTKVPEAISDLEQATKCIAYELFTASGFHFHRANESVLHRYWDAVTNGAPRPQTRNMGDYLHQMSQKRVGDPRVLAALAELKDLHRNPLIHPEQSIENADEAIALMNGVHNATVYMLKGIPVTAAVTTVPAGGVPPATPRLSVAAATESALTCRIDRCN